MLASDGDGVTEDGQGRYVVRINADDANKPKTTDPPKGKPKSGEGSIQISTSNTTKTGESTNGSSTNVGSYIAIAAEQKQKGQYSEAIKTYQKALSTAGDETGYVYQQIAYCYQSKGEKPSAATNYQRAISEYQKLVDSGKQAEKAKDGIRACERGVKICNGE